MESANQSEKRTQSMLLSLLFHTALLILLYVYRIPKSDTDDFNGVIPIEFGGGGTDAAQGEPDRGMNDSPAPVGEESPVATPAVTPPPVSPDATQSNKPAPNSNPTLTTDDADAPNTGVTKPETKKPAKTTTTPTNPVNTNPAPAPETKKPVTNPFGKNGTGSGAGGGGKPGNGGISGGTGNNPFGKDNGSGGGTGGGQGTGSGTSIGGGIGNRTVIRKGRVEGQLTGEGNVVVSVCVDADGNVIEAKRQGSGSTTTDPVLVSKAINAAKGYKFESSNQDRACGTITFYFRYGGSSN
ncbi:MAG: energy transducer TonB [Bacteroidota bacterium]